MALFKDNDIKIFSSREEIRNQLVEEAKNYLELSNVDLTNTSFMSYIINILSILSANQMFYSSTLYREFFLTQAQIQESVYNLSKWIGYTIPQATPSNINVLFTLPLQFNDPHVNLVFPTDFQVRAGDVAFTLDTSFVLNGTLVSGTEEDLRAQIASMIANGVQTEILNNRIVSVRNATTGFLYPVEINIGDGVDTASASFVLPFSQIVKEYRSFTIPDDLEFYQFFTKRLTNLDGQVSELTIYVIPPEIDMTDVSTVTDIESKLTEDQKTEYLWTEAISGLYTLNQGDKSFISTNFDGESEILFGNGIIGEQPTRASTIAIIVSLTKGEKGNVIPASITSSDSLFYENDNNRVQRVKLTTVNTEPATGGKDTPSLSEIKSAAITNLTSKGRLVSEFDYDDFNIIAPNVPIKKTKPILKRSDLKTNEISVFSELIYNNPENANGAAEIVPTRNLPYVFDSTSFFVPRGATIPNHDDFESAFNMIIDLTSLQASYEYILREVTITSALESSDPTYNPLVFLNIPSVKFTSTVDPNDTNIINIDIYTNANHTPTTNVTQFRANLITTFDNAKYSMTTELDTEDVTKVNGFSYQFFDFLNFPRNSVQFKVLVEGLIPYSQITMEDKIALGIESDTSQPSKWITLTTHTADVIIRKDLSDFMFSSITETDGVTTVHNVPTILSSYITQENFNVDNFELAVFQKLIGNLKINSIRMLTDFLNIKFADTIGKLTNMKYNAIASTKIISRSLTEVPNTPVINDTYIVNGTEGIDIFSQDWNTHKNELAQWNGNSWIFIKPSFDEFIQIVNPLNTSDPDQNKKLQWTGISWVEPIFDIPFNVSLKINKDPDIAISSSALEANIKTALLDNFASKFGMDVDIDRSEIVKVARGVLGVRFVEIIGPEIDIRFNYKIDDLVFADLLDYTPQLVAFTSDSISITII